MSRKSIRQNLVRLRAIRSYTMRELGELLDAHVRTVQGWHNDGMLPIDEQDRPLLFLGSEVRSYLGRKMNAAKCKLNPNQCYCLRCRVGVIPPDSSISIKVTDRRVGADSRQVIVRGFCPTCQATVIRFATTKSIQETKWAASLTSEQLKIDGYSISLPKH